jgi:hypothetical protein
MAIKSKSELESEYLDNSTGLFKDNSDGGITPESLRDWCQDALDTEYNDLVSTFENLNSAGDIGTGVDQVAQGSHTHDDRYYTEAETYSQSEVDTALSSKLEANDVDYSLLDTNNLIGNGNDQVAQGDHIHDDRYYTEAEADSRFQPIGEVDYIDFNSAVETPSFLEGRTFWDSQDHAIAAMMDIPGVIIQIGQEVFFRFVNKTGATLANGTVVYISGAQGNRPTVSICYLDGHPAHEPFGMLTHDVENNAEGLATIVGNVRGLDTSSWSNGDDIYLTTTAGVLTNQTPSAKYPSWRIGKVIASHNTQGIIFVNPRILGDKRLGSQVISSTADAITSNYNRVKLTCDAASFSLTSTPTIAAGTDGQRLLIRGADAINTVTMQDERNLSGSGLRMSGGIDFTLSKYDTIEFEYCGTDSKWVEISRSNNSDN